MGVLQWSSAVLLLFEVAGPGVANQAGLNG
jgi:hypothetical protein